MQWKETQKKYMNQGLDDYMHKPITLEDLDSKLSNWSYINLINLRPLQGVYFNNSGQTIHLRICT